jgi:hypothetical protein
MFFSHQGFDVNWGFALFLSPVVTVKLITNSINSNSNKIDGCSKYDKLSLVGMQLPEKYKENFDVSSEGPSSGIHCHRQFEFQLYFNFNRIHDSATLMHSHPRFIRAIQGV